MHIYSEVFLVLGVYYTDGKGVFREAKETKRKKKKRQIKKRASPLFNANAQMETKREDITKELSVEVKER